MSEKTWAAIYDFGGTLVPMVKLFKTKEEAVLQAKAWFADDLLDTLEILSEEDTSFLNGKRTLADMAHSILVYEGEDEDDEYEIVDYDEEKGNDRKGWYVTKVIP